MVNDSQTVRAAEVDLPELPPTAFGLFFEAPPGDDDDEGHQEFVDAPGYTAEQLSSYGQRCREQGRAEGLEQAAGVCVRLYVDADDFAERYYASCAAAIRALKG